MTTTLTKAQRFEVVRSIENDLGIIENGLSALAVFQDALANGANDYSTETGEEALQHIREPIGVALDRIKATLGMDGSEDHDEPTDEPDDEREDEREDDAAENREPESRIDLEQDIADLRNGLAALDMMMVALDGNGVGNDEIVARGIRFAQEKLSAALDSLVEKIGLAEHSTAA